MTLTDQFFKPEDVIYTYTSNQAVEDGILFDLDLLVKQSPLGKFVFQYITTNLLAKGYWNARWSFRSTAIGRVHKEMSYDP